MKMYDVESSTIEAIGYENCVLIVRFVNGSVYSYNDVPRVVFDDFLKASSKGRFLNTYIKPDYDYCRLTK